MKTEAGEPMRLLPFERTMLREHFAGTTEIVVIIPKKNGKTTVAAALALYHLRNWPDAECVIGAASRDQASILFKQAAGLVKRSGLDSEFDVRTGYREIRLKGDRGGPRIRVLAADSATADGVIPTLALVDELHRHPSGDLYGVFRDGLGPRRGRMVTISTAGSSLDSPLGTLRTQAYELPDVKRDEKTRHVVAKSPDGAFVLHEWSLWAEDDPEDMALVKKANPAPWHTVKSLKARHDSPSMTPTQWRRFACGIWVESAEPWIEPTVWDALPSGRIFGGEEVWLGVAVGSQFDPKGLVIFAPRTMTADAVFLPPEASTEKLEQAALGLAQRYQVAGLVWGSWSFRRSGELLAEQGINVREWPYSPERLSVASATLRRLVDSGELKHTRNAALRSQVLAGVVKESDRGWRLARDPHTTRPADALLALAVTVHLGTERPVGRVSVYDDPGYSLEIYAT